MELASSLYGVSARVKISYMTTPNAQTSLALLNFWCCKACHGCKKEKGERGKRSREVEREAEREVEREVERQWGDSQHNTTQEASTRCCG